MIQGMSRDAWNEFSKTILVSYVVSYLFGTLYLDPSVLLERLFAFSWGGLVSLSNHALTCLSVSTCDVFKRLFPLDVQNEIQLLSEVFCYSWLVCLLGFWISNTSLVKVRNPISDGIVFVFHLAWCVRGLKSLKRYGFTWYLSGGQELYLTVARKGHYNFFFFFLLKLLRDN